VPSDRLGGEVAKLLIEPSATRDRLTAGMYLPRDEHDPVGVIELALEATVAAEPIEARKCAPQEEGYAKLSHPARAPDGDAGARSTPASSDAAEHSRCSRAVRAARPRRQGGRLPAGFRPARSEPKPVAGRRQRGLRPPDSKPVYRRRWRAHALPQVAQRARPVFASDLATPPAALLVRQPFAPEELDEVILGCAAPSVDEVNIGRVAALRMGCGHKVPGWTVMRNCASGMQALDSAIANIQRGRSNWCWPAASMRCRARRCCIPDAMVRGSRRWRRRSSRPRAGAVREIEPGMLLSPVIGIVKGLTDPVVGLMMGQTAENLRLLRHHARADGCLRGAQPPARRRRAGCRPLRARSCR
jgi:hypothetical protein